MSMGEASNWSELGTPGGSGRVSRAAGPAVPSAAGRDPDVVDPHRTTAGPGHRRTGLAGAWDSVAYGVQFALLSVFGPGKQSPAADPIERLRRRYGRAARKR